MAPQEFYIRSASETEARGPFNLEQVTSLAEAGQVTPETLYYDATNEKWIAIGETPEVKEAVFPEKRKLSVKREVKVATLNTETDTAVPISVTDMLAAAEGRTEDTKGKSDPAIAAGRCAKIGMWSAITGLLLSAVAEILPFVDIVTSLEVAKMVTQPMIILGIIDVVLGFLLILGMVSLYPFVRFRAALGLGFLGLIFWSQGLSMPFTAVAAGSVGLYLCTVFVSYIPTGIAALLTVGGMGAFAWYTLTS